LIVVSKSQAYLPNPSDYVEEEYEIIEKDFPIDWVSSPIYNIYNDEEDLLAKVNLFIDAIKIVGENVVHHMFDECLKSEILWLRRLAGPTNCLH
jgi:hypothetical protein